MLQLHLGEPKMTVVGDKLGQNVGKRSCPKYCPTIEA